MTPTFPPDFLDLVIELNRSDARYLLVGGHAVAGLGFRMGAPPFRIEILTEISGVEFAQAWPRRETLDADGVTISVIGREDLMRNKSAAARPQDLADVDALERQARTKPR
jgi:hypothetical protein